MALDLVWDGKLEQLEINRWSITGNIDMIIVSKRILFHVMSAMANMERA